jgi:cation diffusion facilitator CzcD-associated flavoprotein CzcO
MMSSTSTRLIVVHSVYRLPEPTRVFYYKVKKYVKFSHRVVSAIWDDSQGKWQMEIQNSSGQTVTDEVDVLLNCGGVLNA